MTQQVLYESNSVLVGSKPNRLYSNPKQVLFQSQTGYISIPNRFYSNPKQFIFQSQIGYISIPNSLYSNPKQVIIWSQTFYILIPNSLYFNRKQLIFQCNWVSLKSPTHYFTFVELIIGYDCGPRGSIAYPILDISTLCVSLTQWKSQLLSNQIIYLATKGITFSWHYYIRFILGVIFALELICLCFAWQTLSPEIVLFADSTLC